MDGNPINQETYKEIKRSLELIEKIKEIKAQQVMVHINPYTLEDCDTDCNVKNKEDKAYEKNKCFLG